MKQWSELFVVAEFVVVEFAVVEFAVAEFGMWERCGLLVLGSLDVHLRYYIYIGMNSVIKTNEGGMNSSFIHLAREFT